MGTVWIKYSAYLILYISTLLSQFFESMNLTVVT